MKFIIKREQIKGNPVKQEELTKITKELIKRIRADIRKYNYAKVIETLEKAKA